VLKIANLKGPLNENLPGLNSNGQSIRRVYDEVTEIWWFSVIDVVQVLTDSENARDYWLQDEASSQVGGRG